MNLLTRRQIQPLVRPMVSALMVLVLAGCCATCFGQFLLGGYGGTAAIGGPVLLIALGLALGAGASRRRARRRTPPTLIRMSRDGRVDAIGPRPIGERY